MLALCLLIIGCRNKSEVDRLLSEAEQHIESRPDSSLLIIASIDSDDLSGDEEKARYALLKSMALDKNYIDTTSFAVLQPTVDYYLNNGTADQRLRTRYYQGRIYQNRGDLDDAINSYFYALSEPEVTDSLTLARTYVAQAVVYFQTYNTDGFTNSNLCAAEIYNELNDPQRELSALANAMSGLLILKDKVRADSVAGEMNRISDISTDLKHFAQPQIVNYITTFGSEDEVRRALSEMQALQEPSDLIKLNIAECYLRIGDPTKALEYFESISNEDNSISPLAYMAVKVDIYENSGKYREALRAYTAFSDSIAVQAANTYAQNRRLNDIRYELEIESLRSAASRHRIAWLSLCGSLVSLLIIGFIYYKNRIARSRCIIAEKNKEKVELELEKQKLLTENLAIRISQLEDESISLKNLLQSREELSAPVKTAIKERIEVLNSLLARDISTNDLYAKPYNEWIERMISDKDRFMDSTRLAFKASHPKFIEYLEAKGLNEFEINYLSLYAIGLRGKEVGEYMKLKRHYNISSDIRRKLGMNEHDTNIGIYVRQLLKTL